MTEERFRYVAKQIASPDFDKAVTELALFLSQAELLISSMGMALLFPEEGRA